MFSSPDLRDERCSCNAIYGCQVAVNTGANYTISYGDLLIVSWSKCCDSLDGLLQTDRHRLVPASRRPSYWRRRAS